MLTGTRLFAGESAPETLGLIFSREPDLALLPAATPARVRTLIERCLVKDPRQRLRDIGEAPLQLEDARDTPGPATSAPVRSVSRLGEDSPSLVAKCLVTRRGPRQIDTAASHGSNPVGAAVPPI
jgi:hypothetical protein